MIRLVFTAFLLAASLSVLAPPATADEGFDLERHAGKVVLVDFWASWCVPCRRSFPWMNAMQARYADKGLVIIGVNVDRDREKADEFLESVPADFSIHYDSDANLAKEFGVEAMPTSFVIGRDGKEVARHLGFKVRRQDEYEAVLREALGAEM